MTEAAKAGLENVTVTSSSICSIDGQQGVLLYRGYDIHDLAPNSTFEEVLYLLWHGELPNQEQRAALVSELREQRKLPPEVFKFLRMLPKEDEPMSLLRSAVSFLASFDPDRTSSEPEARIRKAKRLTSQMATVIAAIARIRQGLEPVEPDPALEHAENFLYMLRGEKPDEISARTMDVALILHAEHGFNASTFAGRVIAATLSDMYSAVVGAIGALKGPLHGGANTAVMKMLLEIGDMSKVENTIAAKLAKKERIMGMGHRVYKTIDPRAEELQELARAMGEKVGNTKWLELSESIWKLVNKQKGLWPNVDFFSASTYYTMGIDLEMYTPIFALSRIGGWTAHIIEQLTNNRLIRPRAEYIGPAKREFVAIEKR